MDPTTLSRIEADPNYQKLVSERKSFGWTLAIIILVLYYGYIAIVAFAPSIIAVPLSREHHGRDRDGPGAHPALDPAHRPLRPARQQPYDDLTRAIVNAAMTGGRK